VYGADALLDDCTGCACVEDDAEVEGFSSIESARCRLPEPAVVDAEAPLASAFTESETGSCLTCCSSSALPRTSEYRSS
jgi:hypothetical protein